MSQDPTQNNRENILEDTTSDPNEELFMTMVHNQHRAAEFIQTSYGNAQRRRSINRERVAWHIQLVNDYFSTESVYTDDMFRWRFRMKNELFLRIVTDLQNHPDGYFKWREDGARRKGLSPLQKCTVAIRQLAYGTPADQLVEYLRMGKTTALEYLSNFCQCLMQIYGRVYLRKPNATDITRLLEMHEQRHGFPGMLGSLDWVWKILRSCGEPSTLEAIMATQKLGLRQLHQPTCGYGTPFLEWLGLVMTSMSLTNSLFLMTS